MRIYEEVLGYVKGRASMLPDKSKQQKRKNRKNRNKKAVLRKAAFCPNRASRSR